MIPFTHLHVHSQYSLLDGAASVSDLVGKAKNDGMKALALTDHGIMFGIKEFHIACKRAEIKPILGCETYVAARSLYDKTDVVDRYGDHLVLLAKNKTGYKNLIKLISIANNEGFYYKPRIDKKLLEKYSVGLIVTSGCLGGEIPGLLMKNRLKEAEEAVLWYKKIFGSDYYLELMRHPAEEADQRENVYNKQLLVNELLLQLARKHNIKVVATNDVHFIHAEDADAHDLLICLSTGKDVDDPGSLRVLWTVSGYVPGVGFAGDEASAQARLFDPLDIDEDQITFGGKKCVGVTFQEKTVDAALKENKGISGRTTKGKTGKPGY